MSNADSSGKVYKIVSILAANKTTGNATIDVNLNMAAAGAGTSTALVDGIIVPGRAVQVVIDKNTPIYVMENRSIVAAANTSTDITISYEDIS